MTDEKAKEDGVANENKDGEKADKKEGDREGEKAVKKKAGQQKPLTARAKEMHALQA